LKSAETPPMASSATLPQRTQLDLEEQKRWAEECIHKHPEASAGVAFCLGVMIGWLIKRL
jgi:ElaB/YqjD/DUF883 family membrane-anchored ribosome-binding protein